MEFKKFDQDKPRTELIPPSAILEVAKVLAFGAKKYSDDNWKKCENNKRYLGAALRHIFQYESGEMIDNETGLSHLSHAVASLLFALELDKMDKKE